MSAPEASSEAAVSPPSRRAMAPSSESPRTANPAMFGSASEVANASLEGRKADDVPVGRPVKNLPDEGTAENPVEGTAESTAARSAEEANPQGGGHADERDNGRVDTRVDGRDTRWAQHRVARRRELVEAAMRAIQKHGAGVGMDEIAAVAGTSKTVIYRHLGDRLGLYLAVCEAVDERILSEITKVSQTENTVRGSAAGGAGDPEVLSAVIDGYLRLVERDPELYRFVVQRPQVSLPDGTDPVTGLSSRIADQLADILNPVEGSDGARSTGNTGTPAQQHREHRARALAWAIVGMVKESADRWLQDTHHLSRSELTAYLATFAASALNASNTPPEPLRA